MANEMYQPFQKISRQLQNLNAMTNRERLIQRLESASENMKSELDYYMTCENRDYDYDLADAFTDLHSIIEEQYQKSERKLWSEIKQIWIDIGFLKRFKPGYIVTKGIKIQTISGKRHPIYHRGRKYEIEDSWSVWINQEN